jgi:hypothetical protein
MSMPSKDDIRREAYARGKTDFARAVIAAGSLYQFGYEVDEHCPRCGAVIEVEGWPAGREVHSVWIIKCSCGACNDTWKGL